METDITNVPSTPGGKKRLGLPFAASHVGPIGLEVSLQYVHMVQLHLQRGQVRLRASASQPLPGSFEEMLKAPDTLSQVIKQCVNRGNFKGRKVITAMPSTLTRVLSVNYELSSGQTDEHAISKLLHDRIGDELADFVVDFMPINHDRRVTERAALIAMCRRESVNTFLDTLSQSGLQPTAMEIGPVAIKRLVDAIQHQHVNRSALIINCGRERSYLTLVANQHLLSDDEISFGESGVLERVCDELEVNLDIAQQLVLDADFGSDKPSDNTYTLTEIIRPELNALVKEIERGLIYATTESRGQQDTSVYLMGSLARWRGADRLLSRLLNHPVKTIPDPLRPFIAKPDLAADTLAERKTRQREVSGRPELAIAAGLALRDFHNA